MKQKKLNSSQGFTLTEVMVAIFVLAVGLLGIAGLQLKGVKGNHSANIRSQANFLLHELAERMHNNPSAADSEDAADNSYDFDSVASIDCADEPGSADSIATKNCSSSIAALAEDASCSPAEVAFFDIYTWYCGTDDNGGGIENLLPSGAGSITCLDSDDTDTDNCTAGSMYQISVSWTDPVPDTDGSLPTQTASLVITP